MLGSSSKKRRAIIIGGSMSGLFTAAFLRQIGWNADVYERSNVELVGRGAGITTHPELLHALRASGAGTENLGIEVPKRFAIDRHGLIISERPLRQILTSWDRLQRLLRATIDPAHYHLGWAFERVEQNGSGVRVHFNGGRVEEADILIGGDGIRSSVRGQVAPELQPQYAGYYIWRGSPNEADLSPKTLKEIFPYFVFYLPPRQEVITYPIAGFNDDLRPGHRRYNFIWYRVADADRLREMNVDENGVQHEFSVPPPLIRKDLIGEMHADARDIMPEVMLDCVMKIPQPFITPIYDFLAPRIVFGRVAMVGDAAANPRPHMGFGVAKAGNDAEALAKALANHDDIDKALKAYNAERQPIGNTIVMHSRKLGTHMGVNLTTEEDHYMHELLQSDEAMMDWIAVPNFLDAYK
jgi:2-polyprenyl-6-methoxyphenol hydroxylase-like FAD-dependent oxidoreductase